MKQALLPILAGLALLAGCGSEKTAEPVTSPGSLSSAPSSGGEVADGGRCSTSEPGYEVTEYDTTGDSTSDIRKLFKTVGEGSLAHLVLVCREADLNGNGQKDIVRFYTDQGRPMREEADRDFDGQIDEVTHFDKGRVTLQEIDSTGNGLIDTKTFYENGQPVRSERDVAGRSKGDQWRPDRWEYYVDGRTVRIGTDMDGDGKVDRWDRDDERLQKSAIAQENNGSAASQ